MAQNIYVIKTNQIKKKEFVNIMNEFLNIYFKGGEYDNYVNYNLNKSSPKLSGDYWFMNKYFGVFIGIEFIENSSINMSVNCLDYYTKSDLQTINEQNPEVEVFTQSLLKHIKDKGMEIASAKCIDK